MYISLTYTYFYMVFRHTENWMHKNLAQLWKIKPFGQYNVFDGQKLVIYNFQTNSKLPSDPILLVLHYRYRTEA